MKKWQAILMQVGLAIAAAFVPAIKNTTLQAVIVPVLAAAVTATAGKTSTSNPDGTPAQAPWTK